MKEKAQEKMTGKKWAVGGARKRVRREGQWEKDFRAAMEEERHSVAQLCAVARKGL